MPKYSEQENTFWTQLMLDGNAEKSRMCYQCNKEIPHGQIMKHLFAHPDKIIYELYSREKIDPKTLIRYA